MVFEGIAAVYRPMAIETGSSEKSVAWSVAGKSGLGIVRCARMALPVMAVLTEVGHFVREQLGVDAAMTGMTG